MKDRKVIEELKELVAFDVEYIQGHLSKTDNENYYNVGIANSMIELVIQLLILKDYEKLKLWCEKASSYFSELLSRNSLDELKKSTIILYCYIISILTGKESGEYILEYNNFYKAYYKDEYQVNKSNFAEYEELVIYLVIAREYKLAKEYTEQLLKLKKGGLVNIIDSYLELKESDESIESLKRECKKVLNRRRSNLAYVLSRGFAYFLFYYRELLKSDNVEELVKAMVFGIK